MIQDAIRQLYDGTVLESMGANNWRLWLQMYRGEYPYLDAETQSLNLACTIASELARTATIEMESTVVNDEEINESYQALLEDVRKITEYCLALGGVIIKPVIDGDGIVFDYCTPDMFVPLAVDNNGNLKRVVFIDRVAKTHNRGIKYFTKLEEHDRQANAYVITNRAFVSNKENALGEEISLDLVEEWADIEEEATIQQDGRGLEFNLYGYFKNPQANNLDLRSSLGVSCFSRATSLIQDADEQYSRILWEYESKETAIDADASLLKPIRGDDWVLPARKERLYRHVNSAEDDFFQVFSPDIRDASLFNGLNQILKKIEDACGLSRGMLSEQEIREKTATEIRKTNQRLYSTVVDIQKALRNSLEDVIRAICFWSNKDYDKLEIGFDFDDSVVVDSKEEQLIALSEFSAGIISKEEYLRRMYDYTDEEIARAVGEDDDEDDGYSYEEVEE